MKTETVTRRANVTVQEALAEISTQFPKAKVVTFNTKDATAADISKTIDRSLKVGTRVFQAELDMEPDDSPDDTSVEDAEPKEDKVPPKPKAEKKEDGPDDIGDSVDDGPDDGPEPKEPSGEEKIVHLLQQILDAVSSGGGDLDPDGPGGPSVDIGAPGPGDALPPPHPAGPGPGGPPHGGPHLPPPINKAGPGTAFAHYDSRENSFSVVRREIAGVGTRTLRAEAEAVYPTHRVAHLWRNGEAVIDGYKVNLPQNDLAVIELVRK